ncbi:hypothetical protein D3C76_1273210 [compost metagenome]
MQLIDFFTVVGVHLHDTANTLFFAFYRVIDAIAFGHDAGIDAHEGQLANERVGHQLECQRREFFIIIGLTGDNVIAFVMAFHRRYIQRRGHKFDHRVQHALDTLVAECRTAQHWLDFTGNGAGA